MNPCDDFRKSIASNDLCEQSSGESVNDQCLIDSDLQPVSPDDVSLNKLISVWKLVPTNIRAAILTLVESAADVRPT